VFKLIFSKEFEKQFDKLGDKNIQKRILKKVLNLKSNPFQGKMLTALEDDILGKLYRIRIGDFRVVYGINQKTNEIYLVTLGHRKNIYDDIV
jgi:mRNA interferase RelE/StbE